MNTKTLFQVLAVAVIVVPAGIAIPRLITEDNLFRVQTQQNKQDDLHARRAAFMAEPPVNTDPTQPKFATAIVGASVERYACEQATKMQLRDPDSYQKISFDDVGDGSAALAFRSRNGFGGYVDGAAVCTVEGTGVRSVLLPL
jgi:hypothetical protein